MLLQYDVIIIGGGIAGLYAALNLNSSQKVLLICKRELSLSNSSLAQGGIAAVYDLRKDSYERHIHDTLVAGGYKNNPEALNVLVTQAAIDIDALIGFGVNFDKQDGEYHLTLEGGHQNPRIFHYKDSTGHEIVNRLIDAVRLRNNITILENTTLSGLEKSNDTFSVRVLKGDEQTCYYSNNCIMATGGIGRVYEYTTNSAIATGDGIVFAYNLGAKIKNISLVQFHPTAFANKLTRESFLISEAVRGEGAYLRNVHKERFMVNYDERMELAPRDVVSGAIIDEAKRTGSNEFYLDITHKDKEFIKKRFPMIYSSLLKEGFDLTEDLIPIFPCQHYLMGGIDVDTNGRTSIEGLYAIGECAHTGVHGNNRLASNSLLEAVVFARRAAMHINNTTRTSTITPFDFTELSSNIHIKSGIRTEVRAVMQAAHFVTKDIELARKGYDRVKVILDDLMATNYMVTRDYIEAKSLTTIAYLILGEELGFRE